jgi:hypothetical protein
MSCTPGSRCQVFLYDINVWLLKVTNTLSLSFIIHKTEALARSPQGCCVDWDYNRKSVEYSWSSINVSGKRDSSQTREDADLQRWWQREWWEKHFTDMTENKALCQQTQGLQSTASLLDPLAMPGQPFLGFRMLLLHENTKEEERQKMEQGDFRMK